MNSTTPGTWMVCDGPSGYQHRIYLSEGGDTVCDVVESRYASLIASASLMIAALNEAKSAMDSIWGVDKDTDDDWIYDEMGAELSGAYFEVRAAIAAATGETK